MNSRIVVAKRCLALAKEIMAADEEEKGADEAFTQRVRNLKTKLNKLAPKQRRKLSQYGIAAIRPSGTVEDLISAIEAVLSDA